MSSQPHKQASHLKEGGATLIQLLIGLMITAFVMLVIERMYFVIRTKYNANITAIEANTKALQVSQALRTAIDEAGILSPFGIWPWQSKTLGIPEQSFNPMNYPPIYAATALTNLEPASRVSGSDVLLVQSVLSDEITTSVIGASTTDIPTALDISSGDYLLLGNAHNYTLMETSGNSTGSQVNVVQEPGFSFPIGSFLAHYQSLLFYLRQDNDEKDIYIMTDNQNSGQELVQKVDDFQIDYYADGAWHAVADETTAGYVNLWYKAVKAVRIHYAIDGQAYHIIIAIKAHNL